jgi:excisionase family DNA binding protein
MDHDLLTAEQLAERLGVKPRTVKEWLRAGLIPATRLTPKVIRYDLEQVVTALKRRQEATEVDHGSE